MTTSAEILVALPPTAKGILAKQEAARKRELKRKCAAAIKALQPAAKAWQKRASGLHGRCSSIEQTPVSAALNPKIGPLKGELTAERLLLLGEWSDRTGCPSPEGAGWIQTEELALAA